MPKESMRKIGDHLRRKIADIRGRNPSIGNRRLLSKCFGKCDAI